MYLELILTSAVAHVPHSVTTLKVLTPIAIEWFPFAYVLTPIAIEWFSFAYALTPIAVEWFPLAEVAHALLNITAQQLDTMQKLWTTILQQLVILLRQMTLIL